MEKSNTPNPLVPKGSLQEYSKGKSNVRIAFFTIAGIHVLFIAVFLIAGCRRDKGPGDTSLQDTNAAPPFAPLTNDTLGLGTVPPSGPPPTQLEAPTTNVAIIPDTNQPIVPEPVVPYTTQIEQAAPPARQNEYSVAKGDTLGAIARKNGISLQSLLDANPGVTPTKLKVGQKLSVPASANTNTRNGGANGAGATSNSMEGSSTYTVKSGDTLTRIARQHGMQVKDLRSLNNLRTDQIRVGQKLKVAAKPAAIDASQPSSAVPGTITP